MKRLSIKVIAVCAAGLFLISAAIGQEKSQKAPIKSPTLSRYVRCGALVQPETGKMQRNVLITIQGERIQQVQENAQPPADGQVIDLSDHTCLPGLIDTHTHTLLQGDITAADYDEQLLKQSQRLTAQFLGHAPCAARWITVSPPSAISRPKAPVMPTST